MAARWDAGHGDKANHHRVARSIRTLACPATSSKRAFLSAGPYRLRAFGTWRISAAYASSRHALSAYTSYRLKGSLEPLDYRAEWDRGSQGAPPHACLPL